MTKFNFICDVDAMVLVKLDNKKQRYSLFLLNTKALDSVLVGGTFPAFESKSFLSVNLYVCIHMYR